MQSISYEVRADTGRVFEINSTDPITACERVSELHQVTVVAWRESRRPTIRVGAPYPS